MHIELKKGLNIPFKGGIAFPFPSKDMSVRNVERFEGSTVGVMVGGYPIERFSLQVQEGDVVSEGDKLVHNKECAMHCFIAPTSGKIKKIHRGPKRRVVAIEITPDSLDVSTQKKWPIPPKQCSFDEKMKLLSESGLLVQIKQRPFALLPDPSIKPRAIFINAALESAFSPPLQLLVDGKRNHLQAAIDFLKAMTDGAVHLTCRKEGQPEEITSLQGCNHHTVSGPYPSSQASVHIHHIDPIVSLDDVVWAVDIETVLALGQLLSEASLPTHRMIAICGEAVMEQRRGIYRVPIGVSINDLMGSRCTEESARMISGDPLTGLATEPGEFLHPQHRCFCCLSNPKKREFLHFFGLGGNKFSGHLAYLSGVQHSLSGRKYYSFDTNNHGEHREMIDGEIYQRVMPMQIPVMHLIKAVISQDLELAQELGLLEVEAEDFALASFVCPCKTEMVSMIEKALYQWGREFAS